MSQKLDKDNYSNTSTTINQNKEDIETFNFKDKSILSILINIIIQYINNINILQFLRLEVELAIVKL